MDVKSISGSFQVNRMFEDVTQNLEWGYFRACYITLSL